MPTSALVSLLRTLRWASTAPAHGQPPRFTQLLVCLCVQQHRFSYNEPMPVESTTQSLCDLALRFGEDTDEGGGMVGGVAAWDHCPALTVHSRRGLSATAGQLASQGSAGIAASLWGLLGSVHGGGAASLRPRPRGMVRSPTCSFSLCKSDRFN